MRVPINALSFAIMVEALVDGPVSMVDLQGVTGLAVWTLRHYVRALYKRELVHIGAWEKDRLGRENTPLWLWGSHSDAKKHHETNAQKIARLRARKRAAVPFGLTNDSPTRAP